MAKDPNGQTLADVRGQADIRHYLAPAAEKRIRDAGAALQRAHQAYSGVVQIVREAMDLAEEHVLEDKDGRLCFCKPSGEAVGRALCSRSDVGP